MFKINTDANIIQVQIRASFSRTKQGRAHLDERHRGEVYRWVQGGLGICCEDRRADLNSGWLNVPTDNTDFSILLHSGHAKAPPAFIQIAGLDPLRDEGILYAKVLQEAGVKVKTEMLVLTAHTF